MLSVAGGISRVSLKIQSVDHKTDISRTGLIDHFKGVHNAWPLHQHAVSFQCTANAFEFVFRSLRIRLGVEGAGLWQPLLKRRIGLRFHADPCSHYDVLQRIKFVLDA